jgi:quinol-cytochrome oxidoreductase complex cytochrome b subunit
VAYFLSYYQNLPAVFVSGAILAIVLFILAAFVVGFLAGEGGVPRVRRASALGTAQRNLIAAFVVASISFSDPELLVTVLVTGLAGLLILAGLGKYMAAQGRSRVVVEDTGTVQ